MHGTIIVQDFQWAGTLGRLNITLYHAPNGSWTVEKYNGALIPVTASFPEDPQVAQVIARHWDPIKGKYAEVVGEAAGDFTEKGSDHADYNLVADAVRDQLHLEFDIENMGGVRAPLVKGPITYADMVSMDPFGNTIVTFKATGKQIKAILATHRPAVSGIRYKYINGQLTDVTIDGKPIEETKVYSGATNNYYARFILADIVDQSDTKQPRLETTLAYIRKQKTVSPVYDGRRVIVGAPDGD